MTLFFSTILGVIVLSSIGTQYAESLSGTITIIPDVLRFTLHKNPGIAFGIQLPDQVESLFIMVALIGITIMAVRADRHSLQDIGFGMIVGGGISNIIDRLLDGTVTDFIAVGTFPIFNIADTFITLGVILIFLVGMARGGMQEP